MQVTADGRLETIAYNVCFSSQDFRSAIPLGFMNAAQSPTGSGSKRIINDGGNVLRFQQHNGSAWQDALLIDSTGVNIFDKTGVVSAYIDDAGTVANFDTSLITREKGDARYAAWHTTEAEAASFMDDLIHFADEGS